MQKPSIPKGTRDFGPAEMVRRKYIFSVIEKVFQKYGYVPIETPAMENLSTLLGKYGEEGDKLLFKILNSGDFLNGIDRQKLTESEGNKIALLISEKGLRYDLTVPFARFVVQHREEITFPFKRYQIQPVWRADKPQKGRYREFFQCDADCIGSNSLLNELDLLQIISEVFAELKIRVLVKLNNRKILAGMAEVTGQADKLTDLTTAIDKVEKIGYEKVVEELKARGLTPAGIQKIVPFLTMKGTAAEKTDLLRKLLQQSETGLKGLEEMARLFDMSRAIKLPFEPEFDVSLARGLNYYTGTIIEVKAVDVEIGSICGGGRYDDLTGIFGMPGISGVGISFGADRIYDVLDQLNLFPEKVAQTSDVMVVNFEEKEQLFYLDIVKQIRSAGIKAELYPDAVKLKKQFSYADARNIPFVIIAGGDEIASGQLSLRNMKNGEQEKLTITEIISKLNHR